LTVCTLFTLSTNDPLMFHHTKEPLMEEYCAWPSK
jgi:adenosine deaminase